MIRYIWNCSFTAAIMAFLRVGGGSFFAVGIVPSNLGRRSGGWFETRSAVLLVLSGDAPPLIGCGCCISHVIGVFSFVEQVETIWGLSARGCCYWWCYCCEVLSSSSMVFPPACGRDARRKDINIFSTHGENAKCRQWCVCLYTLMGVICLVLC